MRNCLNCFVILLFLLNSALAQQVAPGSRITSGMQFGQGFVSPITHVIIIIQENQTPDSFQCFGVTGADCVTTGFTHTGTPVPLVSIPLVTTWDMNHGHVDWIADYNNGGMNGFDLGSCNPGTGSCPTLPAYHFIRPSDIVPYYHLAQTYTFSDRTFQDNQGSSAPAHIYSISGTSQLSLGNNVSIQDNPNGSFGTNSGCTHVAGVTSPTINVVTGATSTIPPCTDHPVLTDLLEAAGLTWKHYSVRPNDLWEPFSVISHVCGTVVGTSCTGADWTAHVINPPSQVLTDIANGVLPNVSWVSPTDANSDHGISNTGGGPSWVISITNAIGASAYWNNTVMFVIWDDWGGEYDHVPPASIRNKYEYGFRVPMITVSRYAKRSFVDHTVHTAFGSTLRYIEWNWRLPCINATTDPVYTDCLSDNLNNQFDYSQTGIYTKYKKIDAPLDAHYFLAVDKHESGIIDDDAEEAQERADGDDDDQKTLDTTGTPLESPARPPTPTRLPIPKGILHLTLQHDLSSKMPDGTMFFAADESAAGQGRLYMGHIRTKHAGHMMRRGTLILDFDDALEVLNHGNEGVVKGARWKQAIEAGAAISAAKIIDDCCLDWTLGSKKAIPVDIAIAGTTMLILKGPEAKLKKGTIIEAQVSEERR